MATYYLRSTDGNDADDGLSWASAKATLVGALAVATAAGDVILVSHQHAETQATSMTLTAQGTNAAPVRIICVNDGTGVPVTTPTATITTTSTGSMTIVGYAVYYGIAFSSVTGNGATPFSILNTGLGYIRFDTCQLKTLSTNSSQSFNIGASVAMVLVEFVNTNLYFFNAGGRVTVYSAEIRWKATNNIIGFGVVPTGGVFRTAGSSYRCVLSFNGVDFAGISSNPIIANTANGACFAKFVNCRLATGYQFVSNAAGAINQASVVVEAINCDSGDTNYFYYKNCYQGVIQQDTANYRTGGWTDGTVPLSYKMVSSAGSSFFSPLESVPILIPWNDTVGSSITVTAHVVTDGITLRDDEAWIEAEYLGTAWSPLSVFIDDRMAILGTSAAQALSTESWTISGIVTPVYQKFSVTFTAVKKGPILIKLFLAKPSTTLRFCPKLVVS